jgi:hypothetical protein
VIKLSGEPSEGPKNGIPSGEAPHRLLFRAVIRVEKHFSKKNGWTIGYRRGGGAFIRSGNKARSAEQFLVSELQDGERFSSVSYPICLPMFAVLHFELDNFYTTKGEINLRSGDTTNISQGVEDALQKAGIIRDDALITTILGRRRFGLQNQVTIELFTDEDAASTPKSKEGKKPSPRKRRVA